MDCVAIKEEPIEIDECSLEMRVDEYNINKKIKSEGCIAVPDTDKINSEYIKVEFLDIVKPEDHYSDDINSDDEVKYEPFTVKSPANVKHEEPYPDGRYRYYKTCEDGKSRSLENHVTDCVGINVDTDGKCDITSVSTLIPTQTVTWFSRDLLLPSSHVL